MAKADVLIAIITDIALCSPKAYKKYYSNSFKGDFEIVFFASSILSPVKFGAL